MDKKEYLLTLQTQLKNISQEQDTLQRIEALLAKSNEEVYSEGHTLINNEVKHLIDQIKAENDITNLANVYLMMVNTNLYTDLNTEIDSALEYAYNFSIADVEDDNKSDSYVFLFTHYRKYPGDVLTDKLNDLMHQALNYDLNNVHSTPDIDIWHEKVQRYIDLNLPSSYQASINRLINSVAVVHILTAQNDEQLATIMSKLNTFPLNKNMRRNISQALFERSGITYREIFREGKIGKRYVTTLKHSQSNSNTRYINGVAITETDYDTYTSGGYNEDRYGFTAVYQFINDSENNYLLDVEISSSIKSTEYKNKSSWSGDDQRVSVDKNSTLSQNTTYMLKAKETLKDQLQVGETKPKDFNVILKKATVVSDQWLSDLELALEGNNLTKMLTLFQDEKAKNWKPDIAANFAKHSFMALDIDVEAGRNFDKDFDSPVTVSFTNNNPHPIKVRYTTNFSETQRNISLKANSTQKLNITARNRRKSDLKVTVELLQPWL